MTTIISWNVNGIRAAAKKGLTDWLAQSSPDILCVQETKAQDADLAKLDLVPDGYRLVLHSAQKRGYSGVGCFYKTTPKNIFDMGVAEFDDEGRVQALEFENFTLINAYFPNSQEKGKRLGYKLDFCNAMLEFCDKLVSEGKNIVLCGDYNIAHQPIDLARPKQNEENPGYLPEERAWMDKFLASGYTDTFRHFTKDPDHYTWWSYRARAREKNIGWRIDYHCVNEGFVPKVDSSVIMPEVMGSDHCPVKITLNA